VLDRRNLGRSSDQATEACMALGCAAVAVIAQVGERWMWLERGSEWMGCVGESRQVEKDRTDGKRMDSRWGGVGDTNTRPENDTQVLSMQMSRCLTVEAKVARPEKDSDPTTC
jgi:hypothetical protein